MIGYNKEEALAMMKRRINRRLHPEIADLIDDLLSQAIDADLAFMVESGVLREDGSAGDEYYEEDDAFEYIVEALAAHNSFTPEQAVKAASLVDDFMDLQAEYMEYAGLVQDEE